MERAAKLSEENGGHPGFLLAGAFLGTLLIILHNIHYAHK
jgi:hypothetical protein